MRRSMRWFLGATLLAALAGVSAETRAVELSVSNYAVSPGGFPHGIALAKGFYKEAGVDVTAIRSSPGSSPAIREMIAGNLPFAEAGITGAIGAIKAGADIKIIGSSVNTFSDVIWITMPNSTVTTIQSLKGRKIGFTSPRSATNMMAVLLAKRANLKLDEVQLISGGSFPQLMTALEIGGVDVVPMVEPNFTVNGSKYKVLARGNEVFPPMSNTLSLTTGKWTRENPATLRAIMAGRRKGVEFLVANPKESAEILGPVYKQPPAVIEQVIISLRDQGAVDGVAYWSPGDINVKAIENILEGAMTTGEITDSYDFKPLLDDSFLPADLKGLR